MPIPSPEERPDLYDDYDGLPEGEKTAVTTPPEIQKLIDAHQGQQQEPGEPDQQQAPEQQ